MKKKGDNVLYIIGNGFDLHHNLKTSYYNFAEYLKQNNRTLYDTLESYIAFPISDNSLWSRFEENLANLDVDQIIDDNVNYLPNIASDEFRDRDLHAFPDVMDNLCESLTTDLLQNFLQFIQSVEYPENIHTNDIEVIKDARFINFNYTPTLERIYNIDRSQINYIHNSAFFGSEDIILGHAVDPSNFEETPPEHLNEDEIAQWYEDNYDYSATTGKENIMQYFERTFKRSEEIIKSNESYFQNLNNINEIYVLGHSISEVDISYFQKVKESVSDKTIWNVSYYNEQSIPHLRNALNSIGVININFFKLNDILLNNRQLRLNL